MIFLNLTSRERRFFYVIIALISFWVLSDFVVRPIVAKERGLADKIAAERLNLEKSKKLIARRQVIQREYDNYALLNKMTGSETKEMSKLMTAIESFKNSSSVRMLEYKPSPVKDEHFCKRYTVELEVEGDANQISRFLYEIQTSDQLLKVDKFQISTKGGATDLLKCRISASKILIP